MNSLVFLFFIHNVLATLFIGVKFLKRNDSVFKNFGIALILDSIAFAAWTFGIMSPGNLLTSVTVGAIFLLISFVFMFYASIQNVAKTTRSLLIALSVLVVIGIFYLGHIDPAVAYISPEGLFFFNLGSLMQMLYIFGLSLAALPAIELVASKFKASYSAIVRYGFIIEVITGIMLITSKDIQVLYIIGWISGIAYLLLWTTLLFNRKAWSAN